MRLFAALLLVALPSLAQSGAPAPAAGDPVILAPTGESFGTFRVELKKDAIDRSSPKALARSWGAIHSQEAQIAERFRVLFEQAHLEILGRYYAPALVAQQQKTYKGKVQDVSQLRCQVVDEKEGPGGRRLDLQQVAGRVCFGTFFTTSSRDGLPGTLQGILFVSK